MRADAKLYAIDINPAFIRHIRAKVDDPRLVAISGRAEEMGRMVAAHGRETVDAIVSSLGLSNMNEPQRRAIHWPGGGMPLPARRALPVPVSAHQRGAELDVPGGSLTVLCGERFLRRYFGEVKSERVMLNFPPARVFTCRHASGA